MTPKEFVDSLCAVYNSKQTVCVERHQVEDKLKYVLSNIPANEQILRNQAAKILHAFIRDVLAIPDITDEKVLQKTAELKDLFDCRMCVSDIMQVYVRGIMDAGYVIKETEMKMFAGGETLTDSESTEIIHRVKSYY